MNEQQACPCGRKKERSSEEVRALVHRLNRIEGQIRGLRGMVEQDAYCPDIMIQAAAVTAALKSFSRELLAEHIRTCVVSDLHQGREESIDELIELIGKMSR